MPKIALIEDDELIADLYRTELTSKGFDVDVFSQGHTGLQAVTRTKYDLLLLDLMLPDADGTTILKQIKANPETQFLTVVIMTNLGQVDLNDQCKQLGAVDVFIKANLLPSDLTNIVRKYTAPASA